MKTYVRGLPSTSIMVKNFAHAMDEKDLRSVFGYVLPMDMALEYVVLILTSLLCARRALTLMV